MKKLIGFVAMTFFLAIPFTANATPLGSGFLEVYWSTPTGGGYYLDYDGEVLSSDFGYTTGLEEVFCVENQAAQSGPSSYEFYAITADLTNYRLDCRKLDELGNLR